MTILVHLLEIRVHLFEKTKKKLWYVRKYNFHSSFILFFPSFTFCAESPQTTTELGCWTSRCQSHQRRIDPQNRALTKSSSQSLRMSLRPETTQLLAGLAGENLSEEEIQQLLLEAETRLRGSAFSTDEDTSGGQLLSVASNVASSSTIPQYDYYSWLNWKLPVGRSTDLIFFTSHL